MMKKIAVLALSFVASLSAQTVTIGTAVFSGSGLNDATSGGRFTSAPSNHLYIVTISATGTPDHFTWIKDGGSASAPVAITGSAQALSDGVTITFAATTGHTLAANWTITATASGSLSTQSVIQRGVGAGFRDAQDKAREIVSVMDFGARGNGTTDDSAAIAAAISAITSSGGTLYFPLTTASNYRFKNIALISNIKIQCAQGVILEMPNGFNGSTAGAFIGIGKSYIDIGEGCYTNGNRASQSGGTLDGQAFGFACYACNHVTIGGGWGYAWTDNILLGTNVTTPTTDVHFAPGFYSEYARRNNMSITGGVGINLDNFVSQHAGATVSAQAGTSPFAGIDVEPNSASDLIGNITGSPDVENSVGPGIQIATQSADFPRSGIHITCSPCANNGSFGVTTTAFSSGHIIGGVTIDGVLFGNTGVGVFFSTGSINVTVNANDIETTANTVAFASLGTYVTVLGGPYCGPTYDMSIGSGLDVTTTIGTEVKGCTAPNGALRFNPAGPTLRPGRSGTFTPVLSFGGGSTGITYGTQVGSYYVVGHLVTATIHIILTNKGSATGGAVITGLPFASDSYSAGVVGYWLSTAGVTYPPTVYVAGGGSGFFILQSNGGTGAQGLLDSNFTNSTEMVITLSYGI